MRKLALVVLLLCAALLAACGGSAAASTPTDTPAPAPPTATATTAPAPTATTGSTGGGAGAATIGMGLQSFSNARVTIKAGQAVTFNDPADTGNVHNLVTGSNGQFSAEAGAPSQFASASGVNFVPGQTMNIVFPTAGTYKITCTIHPGMEATVTVTA
jgi:plastocyanin